MTTPKPTGSFEDFVESHKTEITQVQAMLSSPMSDNPTELNAQLRAIEAQYARMVTIRAFADSFLDLKSYELLPGRDLGTELDRKSKLEALVAPQRRFRDVLVGVCRAIEQRVSLGQSLIKAQEREMAR